MGPAGSVLFVCHANVCRSPLAAALLSGLAADAGIVLRTSSAGVRARTGAPMASGSVREIERLGYPLPDPAHASRLLTARDADEADLVLTATKAQRDELGGLAPAAWQRTFVLGELAVLLGAVERLPAPTVVAAAEAAQARRRIPPQVRFEDLADPVGRDQPEYQACAESILTSLAPLVRLLG